MSRADELPPDQRAALSLLLRQRKSYEQVAGMLGIQDRAVHDRAHAALAVLAPRQARAVPAERRLEVGDYMLGQQAGVAERIRTRTFLSSDEAARGWAQALAQELAGIANGALPEIPPAATEPQQRPDERAAQGAGPPAAAGAHAPAGATDAPRRASAERLRAAADSVVTESAGTRSALPSSRAGGAVLLLVILVVIGAAVIIFDGSGSSGKPASASTRTSSSPAKTSTTPATKSTGSSQPTETARIALRSPSPTSRSIGVVQIIQEGSKRAFYTVAEHISPDNGFFYALWLYNSPTSALPLGKAPPVGSNERLEGGGPLPSNAGSFQQILLTRETSTHATHPGKVILSGRFTLSG